jgi:hypothetical protein
MNAFLTSVDQYQPSNLWCLLWICTNHILVRNNLKKLSANSVDLQIRQQTDVLYFLSSAKWSGSTPFAFKFMKLFLAKIQPVQIKIRWHGCAN